MWKAPEDHNPKVSDVYVIIDAFVRADREKSHYKDTQADFCTNLRLDVEICKLFDIKMPTIIGYKSTEKNPINQKDLKGTEYYKWREKFFKEAMLTKKLAQAIEDYDYIKSWPNHYYGQDKLVSGIKRAFNRGVDHLGPRHPIVKWVERIQDAAIRSNDLGPGGRQHLESFVAWLRPNNSKAEAFQRKKDLEDSYPMLAVVHNGISTMLESDLKGHYVDYVKDMDKLRRLKTRSS
jgi:hypothetical protein